MMKIYLLALCVFLFTSSILIMNTQTVYAIETVTAKGISLDSSSILELKNERGSNVNIDSVRIWLGDENSFKSFKTENGWTGKFEVGGQVLVFSPQNSVKPGESVKFGIKTNSENPVINWKALDDNDVVIHSAVTVTRPLVNTEEAEVELNQPKIIAINDNSVFRLIPEKPSIGSDFRIIGENFIPNQNIDFYIADQLVKSIKIDNDGRFISTSTIPAELSPDRIEFAMIDSGGTEKAISMRVNTGENRELTTDVKIGIDHTPKSVKRGQSVIITGSATPDTTLTITAKDVNGTVVNINTVTTGFDGKWEFNNLFSVDLDLGKIMMEITDGKTSSVRTFELISSQLINISSVKEQYTPGESLQFVGTAIPSREISIIVEDPTGLEVFSERLTVNKSGGIEFSVETDTNFKKGTYILHSYQGKEFASSIVGIGTSPEPVIIVNTSKLNYDVGETVELRIQGKPFASVSIVVVDDSENTQVNDSIDLDENGTFVYSLDPTSMSTGAFTAEVRHGTGSRGSTIFTVGLSTGSGIIEFQTIKNEYNLGEPILIIGNTGNNAILNVQILDSVGNLIREFSTFSDKSGSFQIDNIRIPSNGNPGTWIIKISSGANNAEHKFDVITSSDQIRASVDREDKTYSSGDFIILNGRNATVGASVHIQIVDSAGMDIMQTQMISITATGVFQTVIQLPGDLKAGQYVLHIDDLNTEPASISLTVN